MYLKQQQMLFIFFILWLGLQMFRDFFLHLTLHHILLLFTCLMSVECCMFIDMGTDCFLNHSMAD